MLVCHAMAERRRWCLAAPCCPLEAIAKCMLQLPCSGSPQTLARGKWLPLRPTQARLRVLAASILFAARVSRHSLQP